MAKKKEDLSQYKQNTVNIFFPNQVEPDPVNKEEFLAYWKQEKDRCINGFYLANGQVYIPGWLYWHTTYWIIELDKETTNPVTGKKVSFKVKGVPTLRDVEWMVSNDLEKAIADQKMYFVNSCRGIGKSFWASSIIGQTYTFTSDSESLLTGGNHPDIAKLSEKVNMGLSNIHPIFQKQRIKNNWKEEVRAGWIDRTSKLAKGSNSRIIIRNYDNGNNTMATNGTRPLRQIIDEALGENELLYTQQGTIKIKDCKKGDLIYDDQGNLVEILGKADVGIRNLYKIEFASGRSVTCCDNHIWKVYCTHLKKWVLLTLKDIREKYFYEKYDSRYDKTVKSFIYSIPNTRCLKYGSKDLLIDPYILGLWLGDGFSDGFKICSEDEEIHNSIVEFSEKNKFRYIFTTPKESNKNFKIFYLSKGDNEYPIRRLRAYNLIKNKHIPKEYLFSSEEQRLELLRGLMDTDGSVTSKGSIEFTTSFPKLKEDFKELLNSLGIAFSLTERFPTYINKEEKLVGKLSYRFNIRTSKKIFKLSRKLNNYRINSNTRNSLKQKALEERDTIINITPIGVGQAYCIKVNNESNLFLTTNCIVTHNTGKIPNLIKCVLDSNPSWMNDYGFFALPCLFGTGGDQEQGKDAGIIFNNPSVYNILEFTNEWENGDKIARFFPVTLGRNEYKEDWTLYKFLKERVKGYENLEHHPDLDIIIKVSNEEKCMKEFVEPRRAAALKSTSTNEIIKEKAYYPITPSECFLTISANDFPVDAAKEQLQWIRSNQYNPVRIELYRDASNRLQFKYSDKLPVRDFPVKASSNKEGVIEIIEFPIATSSRWDYCAGIDPYKISESDYSDSLGSIYIFKRIMTSMTEPYQYMPVAWYHGRPKDINTWNENVSMLLEFYNAVGMCENADYGFINHMIQKNRTLYIAEGQSFLKEISPGSKNKSAYGLPPTPAMINHWLGCAVKYTKEEIIKERDGEGNVINSKLGISRILDIMLLEEIVGFNKNVGNYDRVRSFAICVAYAMQLDALFPTLIQTPEVTKPKEKSIKSPFTIGVSMFKKFKSPFSGFK